MSESRTFGQSSPIVGMLSPDAPIEGTSEEARVIAIARILAARAEDRLLLGTTQRGVWPRLQDASTVRRFRQEYLPGGQLLPPDEVEGWIRDQAAWDERDGGPSWWFRAEAWVHPEDILRREEDGVILKEGAKVHFEPMVAWRRPPDPATPYAGALEHRTVPYATPIASHLTHDVRAGGVLDTLRLHTLTLTHEYDWEPAQATTYVLTALIPSASTFAHALELRRGRRQRPISIKNLNLAVFAAEHTEGTLEKRMTLWNQLFPQWAFTRVQGFAWISQQTIRRLVEIEEDDGDMGEQ